MAAHECTEHLPSRHLARLGVEHTCPKCGKRWVLRAVQAEPQPRVAAEGEGDAVVKAHVFDGERCIHCNVNTYDCDCPNDECCNEREPMVYTSQSAPQSTEMDPEKRSALRAFADALPAKRIDLGDN